MIFAYFLGMCSYLAISKTVKKCCGLGLAVTFVLSISVPVCYLLEKYVQRSLTVVISDFETVDLSFLSFIMFIATIASIVQLVEMIVEKYAPALYSSLDILAVNCGKLDSRRGVIYARKRIRELR
jgi:Na+-transporting NADH:ubiquinone oxidoreductase subunit E